MRLEIADARTDLDDATRNGGVDLTNDTSIESRVNLLQQRLVAPEPEVFLDLGLMLFQRGHAKNFNRIAAKRTIRSNSQPCFQREMLVSP